LEPHPSLLYIFFKFLALSISQSQQHAEHDAGVNAFGIYGGMNIFSGNLRNYGTFFLMAFFFCQAKLIMALSPVLWAFCEN
jgi:hypothetical protein